MNNRRNTKGRSISQRGQVVPITAVIAALLLGVAGWTLDAGNGDVVQRDSQLVGDAAALAGAHDLARTVQAAPPAATAPPVIDALQVASMNGVATWASAHGAVPTQFCDRSTATLLDVTFYDTGAPSACPAPTTTWKTSVEVEIGIWPGQRADCTPTPFNCMRVAITQTVPTYLMGLFGFHRVTVRTVSVAYARPGVAAINLPPASAVTAWQPPGVFDGVDPPQRQHLHCGVGPAGTSRCPAFMNTAEGDIYGIDGAQLPYASGSGDVTTLEANGSMVVGANLSICDDFDGGVVSSGEPNQGCPSAGLPVDPAAPTYTVGTQGFALDSPATLYCGGWEVAAARNGQQDCTSLGPGGQPLGQLQAGEAAWDATRWSTSTAWAPEVTSPVSGWSTCGALVLNGGAVSASWVSGSPECNPPAGDDYTIMPGKYSYIVLLHGAYEMAPGIFEFTATAPNNTSTSGPANGIDHSQEGSLADPGVDDDLCPEAAAMSGAAQLTACSSNDFAASFWVGHGYNGGGPPGSCSADWCVPGTPPSAGPCASASSTTGGGGDLTDLTGFGVTLKFDPGAGGFVSTHEVSHLRLTAPNIGSSWNTAGVPLLMDIENASMTHLDAALQSPSESSVNGFVGLIYQSSTASGGGVELNVDVGHHKAPVVEGQVLAYSVMEFGEQNDYGIGVDFRAGYGWPIAPYPADDNAFESTLLTTASLASAGGTTTFTVSFNDELDLDAYDTYIAVDGGPPLYFSRGLWAQQGAHSQPIANGAGPSDAIPGRPAFPFPTAGAAQNPYGDYLPGPANTSANPDWVLRASPSNGLPPGTTMELRGNWAWGQEMAISGLSSVVWAGKPATLSYTMPAQPEATTRLTVYMVDGDGCFDYVLATAAFTGAGGGAGVPAPAPSAIELEQ